MFTGFYGIITVVEIKQKEVFLVSEIHKNIPPELAQYIKHLEEENQLVKEENKSIKEENKSLKQQITNLNEMLFNSRKKLFGKSSEALKNIDENQLSLFNEAEAEYNAKAPEPIEKTLVKAYSRKPKRTKDEIYANVPHKEIVCTLADDKNICEECGEKLTVIGKEKVRSELMIIPAQIFVIDYYREIYKCKACEELSDEAKIIKAEVPVSVMKKSMAAPATVAFVMAEKYQNGVPLYRQESYWKNNGVELSRNTLANWIIRSSKWFEPVFDYMSELLLKENIVHADETELRVLKRNGEHTNSVSRMWVYCSGKYSQKPVALYKYHPTRSAKVVEELFGDYTGILQTDGYAAYNAAINSKHAGCWAHARRKFVDCLPKGVDKTNSKAAEALALIEEIFIEEKSFEDLKPDKRKTKRMERIKPLLDAFWLCLENANPAGGSGLQKAVSYALNHKASLELFLTDGHIELTNNRAERAVKPFVIGRKNFLFSDTDRGAKASALCYSIIETAKLNKLNPMAYLSHLLTELPKLGDNPTAEQLEKLMPWAELPEYCKIN